ncbi:MAG: helix-turn-helix domain-containing protein [Pseudomonadota bacterium]
MRKIGPHARRSDCPIACTLDLIGDRWNLLIIRDLALGKQHFDELVESEEGIATNVLTKRLKYLCEVGLIKKVASEDDARRVCYSLTAAGESLEGPLEAIIDWGLENVPNTRLIPAMAR